VKYSVSIRQPNKIKKLADEIMVNYNDMSAIYDLLIEIPDKEQLEFSSYNFCISAGVIVNGNAPTFLRVDKLCLI
jgi:hypothetical protein